jgi:hypothetical protein
MKKLFCLAAIVAATTSLQARTKKPDSRTIVRPDSVVVVQDTLSDRVVFRFSVYGSEGDPRYRYSNQFTSTYHAPKKEVNRDVVHTYSNKGHLNFDVLGLNLSSHPALSLISPAKKPAQKPASTSKTNTNTNTRLRIKNVDGSTGLYVGFCSTLNMPSGTETNTFRSIDMDLILGNYKRRFRGNNALSVGVGMSWHFYNMTDGKIWSEGDDGHISILPMAEGEHPDRSRLITFGWTVPVMYAHQFNRNNAIAFGPWFEVLPTAKIRTRYKYEGVTYKQTTRHIHSNPVNASLMLKYDARVLDFFVRYNLTPVLDTDYGSRFEYLSFGIALPFRDRD